MMKFKYAYLYGQVNAFRYVMGNKSNFIELTLQLRTDYTDRADQNRIKENIDLII